MSDLLDILVEGCVVAILLLVCAKAHTYVTSLRNTCRNVCGVRAYPAEAVIRTTTVSMLYLGAALDILAIIFHVTSHNLYGHPMNNDFEYLLYSGVFLTSLGVLGMLTPPKNRCHLK